MPLTLDQDLNLTEADFRRVSEAIYKHCGINLHDGKKSLVRSRLAKRLKESRFDTYGAYLDYALSEAGKDEFFNLVDSISTNFTSFFREKTHFDYLKEHVLPRLAGRGERKLRAWSAACSSGEEPYTMAVSLLENLPQPESWDMKILATDVSRRMLATAQKGVYDEERVAPLTGQQKQRFLTCQRRNGEKVYEVNKNLRKLIRFRYLNLMEPWPFKGPFDFIFCRNVMIYFDKTTQEKLVNRMYDCLAPEGVLFIGHSESLTGVQHRYRYVEPATYRK